MKTAQALLFLAGVTAVVAQEDAAPTGVESTEQIAANPCSYLQLEGCTGVLDSKFVVGLAESMQRAHRSANAAGSLAHAAELARAESVAARNAENAGHALETKA